MARRSRREADMDAMSFRELSLRESTLDVEGRSIQAVVATESAVPMPDWQRMEMVPEVLLMSGAEFPKSRQVPLLDSHSRASVGSQLGSVRELLIEGNQMIGRPTFSATAENEFTKVREGHVTDVSVGYEVIKRTYVPEGKSKTIAGREFSGPVNLVTKWRVREVSITPIGADQQAKMRGLSSHPFDRDEKGFEMNPKLRALLVSRGMPADLTDEQAQDWMLENRSKLADEPEGKRDTINLEEFRKEAAKIAKEEAERADKELREKRQLIRSEADSLCELAGLPADFARTLHELSEVAEVRKAIKAEVDKLKDPNSEVRLAPRVTGEGRTRFVAAIGSALALRAASDNASKPETVDKVFPAAQRAKGHEDFVNASLYEMAREWIQMHGVETRGLTREQVAICALFGPEKAGLRSNAAYHTTGSFTNLTLDAVNKAMMVGYTETPATWLGPMRQGSSVPDFKNINRIRMGAIPNLPVWPDNKNPEQASFADAKEVYAVEARSLNISFSYRLLVNDDMDALSRVPAMFGAAARRTVNAVAWAQITSNPTLSDGVALFSAASGNRKRQNLTTGSATPTTTTVAAMTKLMRLMRGENTPEQNESEDVLNLQPVYIVGPAALELLIGQLVNSAYDPNSTTGLQNYNPNRVLTPIIEPLLDADSATAWYLFASPSQVDTVEVSFLQGQESPIVRQFMEEENLSQNFTVLQTFAAKAMNHRGIQKHAGA